MPGDELINSIKQGLSRFEQDLPNDFHTMVYGSKYGRVLSVTA